MTTATALVTRTPAELALAGPLGSFDAYADTVSRIPVLSREDEQELAVRYHRDGDLDAARQLVLSHLRFVLQTLHGERVAAMVASLPDSARDLVQRRRHHHADPCGSG